MLPARRLVATGSGMDEASGSDGPCPAAGPAQAEGRGNGRPPLWRHPAGVFFALAAVQAMALPWLWLLPLADPRLAHLRLALFGFGGAAMTGYVLTALPAWTRHPPVPWAGVLAGAFVLARLMALAGPDGVLPVAAIQCLIGTAILVPMVRGRAWTRLPIGAAPLALGLAEAAVATGVLPVRGVLFLMAALVLIVGGRAIPAFLATEAARAGRRLPQPGPLRPALAVLLAALIWPRLSLPAAPVLAGLILWRVAPGAIGAGVANRMLALGWLMLAPSLPALLLTEEGAGAMAAGHLFLTAAMGGTIFAFAARATMGRPAAGGLCPRPAQIAGFVLVIAAAPARAAAAFAPDTHWLALSGALWSLGWALFLVVHLAALPRPAPYPVLSAAR